MKSFVKKYYFMNFKKIVILFFFLFYLNSEASVSLRNGNFFVGYLDIAYSGGFEPKINRVYNSKSMFKGIFGWGWGNEYEVYLTFPPDGTILSHEFGGGSNILFLPTTMKKSDMEDGINKILEAAKKSGFIRNQANLSDYKNKLNNDFLFRNDEFERFKIQGKLKENAVPKGAKFYSKLYGYQTITKDDNRYIRSYDSGKSEEYDLKGRLIRISDKNKNYISLTYSKEGSLSKIIDNFNRKMFLFFNKQGLVERVEGEDNQKVQYKYNDQQELVYSKDVKNNVFQFKYDKKNRHNMTQIEYEKNDTLNIEYYGMDKLENVRFIKNRDKSSVEYSYDLKNISQGHYITDVVSKNRLGKIISKKKYEYFLKKKSDGSEWTQKLIEIVDNKKTETTYSEQNGLPTIIRIGNEETVFGYDNKNRLISKSTSDLVTQLHYNDKVDKIDRVVEHQKSNPSKRTWSDFQYDDRGNLVFAKNSDGRLIRLAVDSNGRIISMLDEKNHQVSFKYNEHSKPIEITEAKLGSIRVSYLNNGEIKNVESTGGEKVNQEISEVFEDLMSIIRPAGVDLSF